MAYKLLLADDSVTIQRVIELTFADEDIQVIAVGDGRQAIERIAAERPDIVLADVGMPERDGFEVAAFVKQNPDLCRTPVLLLTGAFEPVDEARVRAVGCDGVLAKPFEPQLLIAKVKDLLARPRAASPAETEMPAAVPTGGLDDETLVLPPDDAPAGNLDSLSLSADSTPDSRASVDEYFDRLDAAFATMTGPASERPAGDAVPPAPLSDGWAPNPETGGAWASPILPEEPAPQGPAQGEIPPVGQPVPAWNPPIASPVPEAVASPAFVPAAAGFGAGVQGAVGAAVTGAPPEVAAAFDLILAAEQGQPLPREALRPAAGSQPVALETIVEEVTRRVIERLADRGVRDQVADIVSRIAERIVREEIERLKTGLK